MRSARIHGEPAFELYPATDTAWAARAQDERVQSRHAQLPWRPCRGLSSLLHARPQYCRRASLRTPDFRRAKRWSAPSTSPVTPRRPSRSCRRGVRCRHPTTRSRHEHRPCPIRALPTQPSNRPRTDLRLERTAAALKARGFAAEIADGAEQARALVLGAIPEGSRGAQRPVGDDARAGHHRGDRRVGPLRLRAGAPRCAGPRNAGPRDAQGSAPRRTTSSGAPTRSPTTASSSSPRGPAASSGRTPTPPAG